MLAADRNDHTTGEHRAKRIGWDGKMRLSHRYTPAVPLADANLVPADLTISGATAKPVAPPALRTPWAAAWWIVPAALAVGGAAFAMAWWLLSSLPPLPKAAEEAAARQGAIQTALALGAGIGAAITVMLAFRRQRHQEHAAHVTAYLTERNAQLTEQIAERNARLAEQVAEHNRQDATERRVTELYTKAVEQLGHAGAAVRLGGLYALERLAQGNPEHRQTIVNVICAYLRMPYALPILPEPVDPARERAEALRDARRRHQALRATARGRVIAPTSSAPIIGDSAVKDAEGERQVRLTAQRILAEHLRDDRAPEDRDTTPAEPRFWEGMRLELTGATLIDLDFHYCHVTEAWFDKATFTGNATFYGSTFTGDVKFNGSVFTKEAGFDRAVFIGEASFNRAIFTKNAKFDSAIFNEDVTFNGVTFTRDAMFDKTTFTRDTWFDAATFTRDAVFSRAVFTGYAGFSRVTFTREAWFDGTIFTGTVTATTFVFNKVRLLEPDGMHHWPEGWTVIHRPDGSGTLQWDDTEPSTPEAKG
ncbi:pentapeptide repeat-containing protein [Streptosporangium sp. NPDC049644]|uniref:pentapeptide repeat-containing protein n=1 Tax=Streptosporangium sp. NPDC049644 TaxID=3155507 RepID=UPI00344AB5B0